MSKRLRLNVSSSYVFDGYADSESRIFQLIDLYDGVDDNEDWRESHPYEMKESLVSFLIECDADECELTDKNATLLIVRF